MTNEKLLECLQQVQKLLESLGHTPVRIDRDITDPLNTSKKWLTSLRMESLNHALWLVTEAQTFVETKPDKAHRWLGFAQATLWFCGLSSISDLKDTNR